MSGTIKSLLILPLFFIVAFLLYLSTASGLDNPIVQLTIDGTIGPATDDYIERSLQNATLDHAELVVIRMDTPGGLDRSMRNIIKNITNSSLPVAIYVAPTGSRAASAGTYLLYASHIAAMAPGTNLGAATPVQIGGLPLPEPDRGEGDKKPLDEIRDTSERKTVNDAVAYIQGLAQLHGRNQEWAEKAVREAASLPAADALKLNVIDIVATNMSDLLQQIDGREVMVAGHKRIINTTGLSVRLVEPDWRNRLLSVITNPNIAYILLLIGIYGLIFEFSNPGAIVPGTVGAISLLLALYAFQLLPINYAGMALILLGIALMIAEAFEPSFGVLGLGGIVAFVFGSIILIDTELPGFGIHISVIATFAVTSALLFIFVIGMAMKAFRRPVVSGQEQLLGSEGIVLDDFEERGKISTHSEQWSAVSDTPLHKGERVQIIAIDGLTLKVEPLEKSVKISVEERG